MEEHVPNGGLTDKILGLAYKIKSKSYIKSFTLKDKFIKFYGSHAELLNAHGISADKIIKSILKKMNKKRVIILVSKGFISSIIENELKKRGIEVLSLSRKQLDLTNYNKINALKKITMKNDYILLAAAKAPVKNVDMLIYNLKMLKTISNSIPKDKIKKFVYLSSDAVYADTKKKITENSLIAPNSLHGQMHLIRENYLTDIFQKNVHY